MNQICKKVKIKNPNYQYELGNLFFNFEGKHLASKHISKYSRANLCGNLFKIL